MGFQEKLKGKLMKQQFKCYLSGPISHLTYEEADRWAAEAQYLLSQRSKERIIGYRPLRYKNFSLTGEQYDVSKILLPTDTNPFQNPLSNDRAIFSRDKYDVLSSDVILVNLLGAKKVSIGTMYEMAWANQQQIPIVCIMDENNVHDHPFVRESMNFRVSSLGEAVELVARILLP